MDAGTTSAIGDLRGVYGELGPWMLVPGDRPPSPDAIGWWWRHARDASGIDARWRLHDLRHSRPPPLERHHAIGMGTDVRTVANRLGHANPATGSRRSRCRSSGLGQGGGGGDGQ
ncbi:MAG: hypothetical protein ACYDEN_02480 [Acidimicrobiales bacterium]